MFLEGCILCIHVLAISVCCINMELQIDSAKQYG